MLAFAVSAIYLSYSFSNTNNSNIKKSQINYPKKDDEIKWLDQDSFEVITSICDTFIPHINIDDINETSIKQAFNEVDESDLFASGAFSIDDLLQHKKHLSRGAIESEIHINISKAIQNFVKNEDQFKLYLLLKLLSTSIGTLILSGSYCTPFHNLELNKRINVLNTLRDSKFKDLRSGYQSFKRIVGHNFLSNSDRGINNPSWEAMEYDPTKTISSSPIISNISSNDYKKIVKDSNMHDINQDEIILTDVIVVGSGSGGGMIASELVKAGLNVIVLEKGGYYRSDDYKLWRETEAMVRSFEMGGLCSTADGNIAILAGSCVGGGSSINWSASFRTPVNVLKDWTDMGLTQFSPGLEFEKSMDIVHKLMNVNSRFSYRDDDDETNSKCEHNNIDHCDQNFKVNYNNKMLWESSIKTGFKPERVPRNVKNCSDCGHCCHGCPHESKQSTITSLLEPLLISHPYNNNNNSKCKGSLRIIPNCSVDKILTSMNLHNKLETNGIEGTISIYNEDENIGLNVPIPIKHKIIIKSKIVISSAGALHTPALLLRSGLKHPKIGKHLCLHPVIGVAGIFPGHNTGLSSGVGMGVVVRSPIIESKTAQSGWGVAIETPPAHPGILGLLIPWRGNGLSYKATMLGWKNFCAFIGISRDHSKESNCITINKNGESVINYTITNEDKPNLMEGLITEIRMMRAAGASMIFPTHENYPWLELITSSDGGITKNMISDEKFENYIKGIIKEGLQESKMQVFSAHQMGSCRMSSNIKDGPIQSTGESYECKNLYVADASLFPTSLGINPMITVASFAHMISRNVMTRLNVLPCKENSNVW